MVNITLREINGIGTSDTTDFVMEILQLLFNNNKPELRRILIPERFFRLSHDNVDFMNSRGQVEVFAWFVFP